ncbi:hypothetical protein BJX70DRAFT_357819 [Aspergillus crustosus]
MILDKPVTANSPTQTKLPCPNNTPDHPKQKYGTVAATGDGRQLLVIAGLVSQCKYGQGVKDEPRWIVVYRENDFEEDEGFDGEPLSIQTSGTTADLDSLSCGRCVPHRTRSPGNDHSSRGCCVMNEKTSFFCLLSSLSDEASTWKIFPATILPFSP